MELLPPIESSNDFTETAVNNLILALFAASSISISQYTVPGPNGTQYALEIVDGTISWNLVASPSSLPRFDLIQDSDGNNYAISIGLNPDNTTTISWDRV